MNDAEYDNAILQFSNNLDGILENFCDANQNINRPDVYYDLIAALLSRAVVIADTCLHRSESPSMERIAESTQVMMNALANTCGFEPAELTKASTYDVD